jgi:ABC-type nitrate/sulfonate/bicarbonate transport system substrate-binding protein
MKIAVPDLVSNSYFPAIAGVALGIFKEEGLDLDLQLIFPVDKCYRALRDGDVDFVGGSAHSVPAAFDNWKGANLLAALSQGTYWFLVMRADLNTKRGDIDSVIGRRIGAAPMVDLGIRRILQDAGLDLARDRITIMPVPGSTGQGVSFGVNAAKALENGLIDGFWANGMGAEVAVRKGVGAIVLDARRGDGPAGTFNHTMPVLVTTETLVQTQPEQAAAAVRAIMRTQNILKRDLTQATEVGRKLFPALESKLIAEVVRRDLPFYYPHISRSAFEKIAAFSMAMGLASGVEPYDVIVPSKFVTMWDSCAA